MPPRRIGTSADHGVLTVGPGFGDAAEPGRSGVMAEIAHARTG
jgi:hypothetical protein